MFHKDTVGKQNIAKTCICNVLINDLYWPIVPRSILYSMLSVDHHVDCKHIEAEWHIHVYALIT